MWQFYIQFWGTIDRLHSCPAIRWQRHDLRLSPWNMVMNPNIAQHVVHMLCSIGPAICGCNGLKMRMVNQNCSISFVSCDTRSKPLMGALPSRKDSFEVDTMCRKSPRIGPIRLSCPPIPSIPPLTHLPKTSLVSLSVFIGKNKNDEGNGMQEVPLGFLGRRYLSWHVSNHTFLQILESFNPIPQDLENELFVCRFFRSSCSLLPSIHTTLLVIHSNFITSHSWIFRSQIGVQRHVLPPKMSL